MAYKILEANGVDNENIDGAALNNFIARDKSGIINGVLSECALTATGSQIGVSPGLLLIHGIRVKITEMETLGLTSAPVEPTEYQIVAQVVLGSSGGVLFSLFLQLPATLTQEELYVSDHGTYQVELGRFTHATDGSITNLKQTLKTIGEAESATETPIEEWDGETYYAVGDIVIYGGNIYRCISDDSAGDEPSEYPNSWELISKGEKRAGDLSITATFNITEANTVIILQKLVGMTSIDWGDDTVNNSLTHTYAGVGEYTCMIYGCTSVGAHAFWVCSNLTSVTISDSVTSIGQSAFDSCDSLTNITMGKGVTSIGSGAHYLCSNLKTLTINATTPPTLANEAFLACTALTKIIVPAESLEAYKTAWSDYATIICSFVYTTDRNEFVKEGITENTLTMTDEDKANACEWLGAVRELPVSDAFSYAYIADQDGVKIRRIAYSDTVSGTIVARDSNGCVRMSNPVIAADGTNKNYVDNLPDYLTLTDEQKAKWKTWLESILN